jgi:hypothetical protein
MHKSRTAFEEGFPDMLRGCVRAPAKLVAECLAVGGPARTTSRMSMGYRFFLPGIVREAGIIGL